LSLVEAVRRALEVAMANPDRLAEVQPRAGPTMRLGALPMPAELGERLAAVAAGLGVSISEVVRRGLTALGRATN